MKDYGLKSSDYEFALGLNLCYTHTIMEKILLLNPPGKYRYLRDQYCSSASKADYYWPAIDLLVLSGILGQDFKICVLDAIAENLNVEQAFNIIDKGGFKAIISLASSASKDEDFTFFETLKKKQDITLIANAGFLRSNPQKYIKQHEFLDAIIIDFTQNGILKFLKGFKGNLPGLCYRHNAVAVHDPESYDQGRFSYSLPKHELFPLGKYRMPQAKYYPLTCVLAASGCNYRCRFCSSATIPFRLRNIDNLMGELAELNRRGIKEIHFPDFTFTGTRQHVHDICNAILEKRLDISWDCLTRTDCLDSDLIRMMRQAGCHTIQLGVESKNEQVLKDLGKPIKNETMKWAFRECQRQGIETIGFFIIGFPGEDKQSIQNTITFAKELDCDYASFSVFMPDFGADIRTELEKKYPALENTYNFDRTKAPLIDTPYLKRNQIWGLRNQAIRSFYFRPCYIWKRFKKIKSLAGLKVAFKIFWSILKMQIINL